MAREKSIEKKMRLHVESLGGVFLKLDPSNFIGIPDRLAVLPGPVFIFIEIKRPSNTTSSIQDEVIKILRLLGCEVLVADNLQEVIKAIADVKKKVRR